MEIFKLWRSIKTPIKPSVSIAIIILMAMLISPAQPRAKETANLFAIKGKISGSIEDAPQNVQDVLSALIVALRGEQRPDHFGPVVFDGDNLLRIRKTEGTFFYTGFDVHSIQISYIGQKPEDTIQFIGRILWEDANQRRAATAFTLSFAPHQNFTLIKHVAVSLMPPNTPRVVTFLVPEKKVQKQLKDAKDGYLSLLELVATNAVSPDKPPFFLQGKHNYLLFTFSLDRLAKGGRVDYITGGDNPKMNIRPKQQKRIDYAGWQVLILATTLDLRENNSPPYQVFYTPTPKHPRLEHKPYLISSFKLGEK